MKKEDIKIGTVFFNGYQSGLKQCHLITKITRDYVYTIGLVYWNEQWKLNTEEMWYKSSMKDDAMSKVGELDLVEALKPFISVNGEL